MLVLDLCCAADHRFEGWFGSAEDFSAQLEGGRLSCPVCNHADVRRVPSAARLNVSHLKQAPTAAPRAADQGAPTSPAALQQAVLQQLRQLVNRSEDLGERFADEARRMHHGEIESRAIRGRTSAHEAIALLEEGIEVLPLPPDLLDPLH